MAITAAVVVITLVGVGALVLVSGPNRDAAPPPRVPTTTRPPATSTTAPPSTRPSPSRTIPSPTPSATISTPRPSASTSSTAPPRGQGLYADHPALSANPFYAAGFGTWGCTPVADPQVPSSSAAFRRYVDGLLTCLMNRYGPPVRQATGSALTRPSLQLHTGQISTPCGTNGDEVPFYCSGNQTIYLNPATVGQYDDYVRLGGVTILAHEFAHHVQYELGVLSGAYRADLESPDQISRRIELQAECFTWSQVTLLRKPSFGGVDEEQFRSWVAESQDSRHGTGESYTYWYQRIRGQGRMALCNTWTAPTSVVR